MSGMSPAEWGPEATDDGAYLDQLMQDDLAHHYDADEWSMEPMQLLKTEPPQFVDVSDAMALEMQQIMPPHAMNDTPPPSGMEYASPSPYSDSGDDAAQRVRSMSITSSSSGSSSVQHGNSSSNSSNTSYASVAHMTPYERKQHSLMLRRKRNRESMRRSRLRDKETLTSLKDTVAALEQKYTQLTSIEHRSTAPEQAEHFLQLQDKLSRVIQAKRHLETERQAFEHQLQTNQDLIQQVTQIVDECQLDDDVAEKLALLEGHNPELSDVAEADKTASASQPKAQPAQHEYGFVPLPEIALDQLIAAFCENVQRVKTVGFPLHQPSAEIFGWTARRHVDEQNHMHFEFVKAFKDFSAWELMKRTWLDGTDLVKYRQAAGRANLRRLDFLQRVSNDVCVIVRELVHPVDKKIFRTHYVMFWKETKDGYCFGIHSINPKEDEKSPDTETDQEEPKEEQVLWIDVSVSIEFVRKRFDLPPLDLPNALDLPTEYCEIRWQGKTNYKSPKLAAENAVEYLMGLLKWENSIVGPRFHLTAG